MMLPDPAPRSDHAFGCVTAGLEFAVRLFIAVAVIGLVVYALGGLR